MRRAVLLLCAALLLPAMGGRPELVPFFDAVEQGSPDRTPPPPILSPFDEAVQDLCGAWGGMIEKKDFLSLLNRFPQESKTIRELGQGIESANLAQLWFGRDGFRHVFCGEPEGRTLGGMHWVGRYLQAQREGWAGLMETCERQEIAPPVYTIGTVYRRPDGSLGRKCPGGYAYSESAMDILAEVTRAAVQAKRRDGVCIGEGMYPGGTFPMVVVIEGGAIVTAYPDVSPPGQPSCQQRGRQ